VNQSTLVWPISLVTNASPPVIRGPGADDLSAIMWDDLPRTPAEVAAITGKAHSTGASRVGQLTAADWVKPVSRALSTVGRRAARLVQRLWRTVEEAVSQAGRDIGEVLAACVSMLNPSMLNPSMIVIGGSPADAGEHLLAGIREVVYSRSIPMAPQRLRVVQARTRGQAGILGASRLAADLVTRPSGVDLLVNTLPASTSSSA
jgi:ROK family